MKETQSDNEQVLRGVVKRITFRNPSNGYTVMQLAVPDKSESITVVGSLLSASVGAHLLIRGSYHTHPKYGEQFHATGMSETTPSTTEGLATYLGSGLIKGIGPKTAKRLVKEFGTEVIEVISQEPERVANVPGVGSYKAKLIAEGLVAQGEVREVMRFLMEHNVSPNLASRIYEKYGNKTVEVLSRDPYLLARQMRGIGFLTADTIALNIGLKEDSPERLKAGVYYALEKAADDGHCYLPEEQLLQRARVLLGIDETIDLSEHIDSLIEEDYLVRYKGGVFLKHLFKAEEFVSYFINDRHSSSGVPILSAEDSTKAIDKAESELGITFSNEQREAVIQATKNRLLIITGGPGCGKTTVIRALAAVFSHAKKRTLFAAPTGRAAQRMSQVTDRPASTIHRLLRYDPIKRSFLHGPNEPLIADAIIIDEASMLDINLAKDLFSAIPAETHLVLVGDKDQLPSVGPGRVFGDLVTLNEVKTISLSQLFRRSEESQITSIAHLINAGTLPNIPEPDGQTKTDAYFIPKSDPEETSKLIESLVSTQIPEKFDIDLTDITVLTPSNRGPLGTITLNQQIQAKVNPPGSIDSEQELEVGNSIFRIGDRVCQRVNNYQLDDSGVFNGDIGKIYQIDRSDRSMVVELWDGRLVKYSSKDLHQLSLAYAVTVHRSQGSEIPCVILALHDSHYTLLERQLIYTGITRAKQLLIVVGSKRALQIACRKTSTRKRCTMLRDRVRSGNIDEPIIVLEEL